MKKLISLLSITALTASTSVATSNLISCSKTTQEHNGDEPDIPRTVDFELKLGYVVDFLLEKDAAVSYGGDAEKGIHVFLTVGNDNKINTENSKLKEELSTVIITDGTQLIGAKSQILEKLKNPVNELETDLTVTIDSIIKNKDLGVLNSLDYKNITSEQDIVEAINLKNNLNIKQGDFNIDLKKEVNKAHISVEGQNKAHISEFNVKVFSGSTDVNYTVKSINNSNIKISDSDKGPFSDISNEIEIEQSTVYYWKLSVDGIGINFLNNANVRAKLLMDNKEQPVGTVKSDSTLFNFLLQNNTHHNKNFEIHIYLNNYVEFVINGICKNKPF